MSERSEDLGTLIFVDYRSTNAFQFAYCSVAIDGNYQRVTQGPRRRKIAHVADVQQIKDPVGENQRLALSAQSFAPAEQFVLAQNLFDHR